MVLQTSPAYKYPDRQRCLLHWRRPGPVTYAGLAAAILALPASCAEGYGMAGTGSPGNTQARSRPPRLLPSRLARIGHSHIPAPSCVEPRRARWRCRAHAIESRRIVLPSVVGRQLIYGGLFVRRYRSTRPRDGRWKGCVHAGAISSSTNSQMNRPSSMRPGPAQLGRGEMKCPAAGDSSSRLHAPIPTLHLP